MLNQRDRDCWHRWVDEEIPWTMMRLSASPAACLRRRLTTERQQKKRAPDSPCRWALYQANNRDRGWNHQELGWEDNLSWEIGLGWLQLKLQDYQPTQVRSKSYMFSRETDGWGPHVFNLDMRAWNIWLLSNVHTIQSTFSQPVTVHSKMTTLWWTFT